MVSGMPSCVCILAATLSVVSALSVDCPVGSYFWGGFKGEHFCIRCPGNRTSPGCKNCKQDPQARSCLPCRIGQYLRQDHYARGTGRLRTCSECPVGKYIDQSGMAECKSCLAGTFSPYSGQDACLSCSSGQFTSSVGNSVCTKCTCGGINKYPVTVARATAARQCTCWQCPGGKYSPAAHFQCYACKKGQYRSAEDEKNKETCDSCPKGYFSHMTAKVCAQCKGGRTTHGESASNASECSVKTAFCPIGQYSYRSANGGTEYYCMKCGFGRYGAAKNRCNACPKGQFNEGMGKVSCTLCSPDKFSAVVGSASCSACPMHYFAATGLDKCVKCKIGKFTSTYILPISPGECVFCNSGKLKDWTLPANGTVPRNNCEVCGAGKWQSWGQSSDEYQHCRDCPAGKYQANRGQALCHDCRPGKYQRINQATRCITCKEGSFQSLFGKFSCTHCHVGRYGDLSRGSESDEHCADCPGGYHQNQNRSTSCFRCKPGRFQDVPGSSKCERCSSGKYAKPGGGGHCAECPEDYFTDINRGAYYSRAASAVVISAGEPLSCRRCPKGRYSKAGMAVCGCAKGHYQAVPGEGFCQACPSNYFNNGIGAASCKICPAGYFSKGVVFFGDDDHQLSEVFTQTIARHAKRKQEFSDSPDLPPALRGKKVVEVEPNLDTAPTTETQSNNAPVKCTPRALSANLKTAL